MKRVAILGGGIAGLAAAYELELARKRGAAIDWHLYEATDRLGGIVETTRLHTPEGEWILEGGPDAWVSEKPWARELAIELGLESELIHSNDATRKTYIYLDGQLQAMPDRMRMMVPEDLTTLDDSPLFSDSARQAYADELTRADELKRSSPFTNPAYDESVSTFVHRHFGDEVLQKIAAPLLSGVFGGDVDKLSVRAVMAPFVKIEQEHGSLIAGVQQRARERGDKPPQPIFTTLRRGVGSLVETLVATLPHERLHICKSADHIDDEAPWSLLFNRTRTRSLWTKRDILRGGHGERFDQLIVAASLDSTRDLLKPLDQIAANLLPTEASSAVLTAFCWSAEEAATMTIPPGFGFLVPPKFNADTPQLVAATFVDQKFPHRAPKDARILRVFFGTGSAEQFANTSDAEVARTALDQLRSIMGPLPEPSAELTTVRRWSRSLPQYAVGHLASMTELERRVAAIGDLHLLGNSYRGVGLPDLIRDARNAARNLTTASI